MDDWQDWVIKRQQTVNQKAMTPRKKFGRAASSPTTPGLARFKQHLLKRAANSIDEVRDDLKNSHLPSHFFFLFFLRHARDSWSCVTTSGTMHWPWSTDDKPPAWLAFRSSSALITVTVSFAVFTVSFFFKPPTGQRHQSESMLIKCRMFFFMLSLSPLFHSRWNLALVSPAIEVCMRLHVATNDTNRCV